MISWIQQGLKQFFISDFRETFTSYSAGKLCVQLSAEKKQIQFIFKIKIPQHNKYKTLFLGQLF